MTQTHFPLLGSAHPYLREERDSKMQLFKAKIKKNINWKLWRLKWVVNKSFLGRKHHVVRALLVVTAVVLIWRGIWELLDFYLIPGSPTISNLLSIAIGFALLFLDDFRLDEVGP